MWKLLVGDSFTFLSKVPVLKYKYRSSGRSFQQLLVELFPNNFFHSYVQLLNFNFNFLIFNKCHVWLTISFLYSASSLIKGFKRLLSSSISFSISYNVFNNVLHSILFSNVGSFANYFSVNVSVVISITSFCIFLSLIKFLNCSSLKFSSTIFSWS